MTEQPKIVGLLYPGEMGVSLANLFRARGARVITTLRGRSAATAQRCGAARIEIVETIGELARQSDYVVSVVPPGAAEEVAAAYCEVAHLAPEKAMYLDLNSIGPALAEDIAHRLGKCRRSFVDGAINGLAKNLTSGGTLFLSGGRAGEVAEFIGDAMRVRVLGDEPGRASAMKLLLSGLSKGVCALFTETALLAHKEQMLPEMMETYRLIYPGVMEIIERMLPTYAQHAGRRAKEMRELEETARRAGVSTCVLTAIREVHEEVAACDFETTGHEKWNVAALIERLAEHLERGAAGERICAEQEVK